MTPDLSGTPYLTRSAAFPVACLSLACLLTAAFLAHSADEDWKLVSAAKEGNERLIRQLLDAGVDPRGQAARHAVVEAVKNGQVKALEVLLSRGASADAEDRENHSFRPRKAITLAAAVGSEESVALLLRHGASPNARNQFPFRFTFEGGSPSRMDDNHKSALMYAAEGGHVGVVRQLLKAGANPNAKTVYDETALMIAAGKGRAESVRVLIEGGADLNATAGEKSAIEIRVRSDYGGTALTYAVRHALNARNRERAKGRTIECKEYMDAAYEIIAGYKRMKERVDYPRQALGLGLWCGDIPLISGLVGLRAVERGSDVLLFVGGHPNEDKPEAVELLIRAGADVNARNEEPWDGTPLMRAASDGWGQTVTLLLDAGAEINATTTYGETALWHAARSKRADIVTLLLARGANPNIVTKPSPQWFSKGGSALNVAVRSGCMECAKELLLRGADPKIPDMFGSTPVETLRKAGLLPESGSEPAVK